MTFSPIPPTRRDDIVETLHGVEVPDPYRWLEDGSDPDVRRWVNAQDAATRARLDSLSRHGKLTARLDELLRFDAMSPFTKRGERRFVTRRRADLEKAVVSYTDGDDPQEHVLFDPNTWSDDGTTSLGYWIPSHSGRYVAYAVKANAADESTLHVRDLDTGSDLELDVIEGAKYAMPSWMPGDHGFYYTWLPTDPSIHVSERPGHAEVRSHALGTDPADDARVYPATGSPRTFIHGAASHDGRWLVVPIAHGWNSTDVFVKDLCAGDDAPFTPFRVGHDARYEVTPWRDRFYVFTNEGAPRGRVFEVDPADMDRASWREIVPESADTALSAVQIIGDHLVLTGLRHATTRIEIRTLAGELVREQPLPGLGTVEGFHGEPDDPEASFAFQSFVQPTQIWRTDVATGDSEKIADVDVPLDVTDFVTEQVRYESKDGTEITMFLLRHRDTSPNEDRPTILYGYGGFNVSLTPAFRPELGVWLEAGGIYAVPNLRGGGEYGEAWHRDGMLDKKQNVFDDFIAAAEYLIASGWTNPDRLAIRGGSNGGLLVGAAMTQRPDLFRAVICAVPLLDMLRYHLFGSGRTWIPEYGTAEDPEQFAFIEAYSPYRHVKEGVDYPALLMLASDSDDRVDPCHARKFIAAVQGASTGGPNWLRVERNAGHGGADKVGEQVSLAADWLAFSFDQLVDR